MISISVDSSELASNTSISLASATSPHSIQISTGCLTRVMNARYCVDFHGTAQTESEPHLGPRQTSAPTQFAKTRELNCELPEWAKYGRCRRGAPYLCRRLQPGHPTTRATHKHKHGGGPHAVISKIHRGRHV